jgi:hypothetical protein
VSLVLSRSKASAAVASCLGAATLLLGSAVKAEAANRNCPDFLIIGSRGSGNAPGQDEGLGAPGKAFADRFTALVGKNRVKVSYNPYEAVGILPALQQVLSFLTAQPGISRKVNAVRNALNGVGALARQPRIGAYHDSVLDGESKLRTTIEDEQASCKNTKLLLVGYSQGAQVSADVYQQLSASKRQNVFGVVLFGDPRYSRSSFADQARLGNNGILPVRGEFPDGSRGIVLSYCHARDPICQGLGQFFLHGDGAHKSYQKSDAFVAAEYFAKLSSGQTPPAQSNWPINKNGGPPALFVWLGANFLSPEWSSCSSNYCIVGLQRTVLVLKLHGIEQITEVRLDVKSPSQTLLALQIPAAEVAQLLSP